MTKYIFPLFAILLLACNPGIGEKGFPVSSVTDESEDGPPESEVDSASNNIQLLPSEVLLTGLPHIRLTPLFKLSYDRNGEHPFIGTVEFASRYNYDLEGPGDNWNEHLMPGFELAYGYNMLNVSVTNHNTGVNSLLFETPVLIKSLYYPCFHTDTSAIWGPVVRDRMYISAFDNDTNGDGKISPKDLRRFFGFHTETLKKLSLIPANESVFKSQYDPANDHMILFTRLDQNQDGMSEMSEPVSVYSFSLSDPEGIKRICP